MRGSSKPAGSFGAVFVSPHLDDAVLACGGTIAQLATTSRVLVVNVFTHYPSQFERRTIRVGPERYQEECDAAKFLGYESINMGETDAIFRSTTDGSPGRLFRPPTGSDLADIGRLGARLDAVLAGIHFDALYIPMGIGWHVDHMLCHLATRRYLTRPDVLLYEDAPYCLIPNATRYRVHELGQPSTTPPLPVPARGNLPRDWWTTSLDYVRSAPIVRIQPLALRLVASMVVTGYIGRLMARHLPGSQRPEARLDPVLRDVSETFERKISACYLYESQIKEFFLDRYDCMERYQHYSESLGPGKRQRERFWTYHPRSPTPPAEPGPVHGA